MSSAAAVRRIAVTAVDGHTKGVRIDKLDPVSLEEAIDLRELGDQISEETSLEQRAVVVHLHMMDGDAKGEWECVKCEACDGAFDEGLPKCPYCGVRVEADDDGDDGESPTAVVEARASTPSLLSGAGAASSKAIVPVAKIFEPPTKAITKATAAGLMKFTVADLDEAVAHVRDLKGQFGASWWEIGKAIAKVYDNSVWRLRVLKDGRTQAYRTWEQACEQEFGLSHQSALNAMDASKLYSKEYAEKYGRSKLSVIVRAHSEADRKEMERQLESGASLLQIKETAKTKTDESRKRGESIPRRKMLPSGEVVVERAHAAPKKRPDGSTTRPKKKPQPDQITVAAVLGTKGTSKLWASGGAEFPAVLDDASELSRAKKFEDDAVGVIELKNAVSIYVRLIEKDGGLAMQWTIGREKSSAE
jgi:hypothetical protein